MAMDQIFGRDRSPRKPARQGDLDGLCGFYAVINAMELVAPHAPGPSVQKSLFAALTRSLSNSALQKALVQGLDGKELVKASRPALSLHHKVLGSRIMVSRPFRRRSFRTNEEFISALTDATEIGGVAFILNIATPRYAHWTVVESASHTTITLRDSTSMRLLALDRYTIGRSPYRIHPRETLEVRVSLKRSSR